MDNITIVAIVSIVISGITTAIGVFAPSLAEGRAVAAAMESLAQQPDASPTITRTLFVGLAMIESSGIYCFVISMILIFANQFWNHFIGNLNKLCCLIGSPLPLRSSTFSYWPCCYAGFSSNP